MLSPDAKRPPFPAAHFWAGLALFVGLSLCFQCVDWDRQVAAYFYQGGVQPWPGRSWAWAQWCYVWGERFAPAMGLTGLLFFGLSFTKAGDKGWRGPGLYLALLLLLGPGLLSNGLGKALAGRPRPEECQGFGGLWDFQKPFHFGVPGRGKSFLSGHAAAAWYLLGLPFLLDNRRRRLAWVLAVGAGLAMCLARVSQGAHWLSDTLLAGAGLYTLAAGLSPLIHWQPSAQLLRSPAFKRAVAVGLLAYLSVAGVDYQDVHVLGLPADADAPLAPQQRAARGPKAADFTDVMAQICLGHSDLHVSFNAAPTPPWLPFQLDLQFQGQGLPFSRDRLKVGPLPAGGAFQPEPGSLAVDVQERQVGWFYSGKGNASLALPANLPIDARLRLADGTLSIDPLPAGRRVLLARVPRGTQLPVDFVPYGSDSWLRNGQPPLIALDLDATQVVFLAQ
ncbi:MAG TPA: phosphatase PAP2 family protein [bacterium]|nr:phosphatase PAP2 family protein [bacterium]